MKKRALSIMLIGMSVSVWIPSNVVLANENYNEENSKFVFQELNYKLSEKTSSQM